MSRAPLPNTARGERPMPSSFDDNPEFFEEGWTQKLTRRLKEEPLIPIGLGLTTWALLGATRSIRRGDKTRTNHYFRARVYAQAFTLLVLCVGSVYWREDRQKRKHYEGLVDEKKATEKRDAWIRELELRDEEDQRDRARRRQRRDDIRAGRIIVDQEPEDAPPVSRVTGQVSEADLRKMARNSNILSHAMPSWRASQEGQQKPDP